MSLRAGVVVLSVAAIIALFTGCSSETGACSSGAGAETTGGCGGAEGSSSASSGSSNASGTSSSASGMTTGGVPDVFDLATEIGINEVTKGDLNPTGDIDYYKFDGVKDQVLYIYAAAQDLDYVSFDPQYIDTVVTLFGPDKKQLAENNNRIAAPSHDSVLFTILPADGTYYLRVTECFTWAENSGPYCIGQAEKQKTQYELRVYELSPQQAVVTADTENNNEAQSAEPIKYAKIAASNGYYMSVIYGTFTGQPNETDVDVFSFQPPNDIPVPGPDKRLAGYFHFAPAGTSGTGSSAQADRIYVTEATPPYAPFAEIQSGGSDELLAPLKLGTNYLLFVTHKDIAFKSSDFYFSAHFINYANPIEQGEGPNNSLAGAELIPAAESAGDGKFVAYIEGDLPSGDVDNFKVAIPQSIGSTGTVKLTCAAWYFGSGLRNLKVVPSMLDSDSNELPNVYPAATEISKQAVAQTDDLDIPDTAAYVAMMLTATQDPVVTGSFYRCGFHFTP